MKPLLAVEAMLLMISCSKILPEFPDLTPEPKQTNSMLSFKVVAGKDTINANITDTLISIIVPEDSNRVTAALFTSSGVTVSVDGVEQTSGISINNFKKPVVYTVKSANGSIRSYAVHIRFFTGLPVLRITTEGAVSDRDNYVKGTIDFNGNLDYHDAKYLVGIRGRGNSTWWQAKKPYKIKLDNKSTLLNMPADKEWALLANYFDNSLVRNDVALELGERMNMAWTPRRRFVEVFLNNEYIGNYLLTETVKTGSDRLNIEVMSKNKPGGYLLEADFNQDAEKFFVTNSGVRFSFKEPELPTDNQFSAVKKEIQDLEDAVADYKDVTNVIDMDSWIKWTIVEEVMRNRDGVLFGSDFFYKENGKFKFGPLWDFDLSSGGYNENVPEGWYVNHGNIVGGLFRYHEYYRQRYKEIWNQNHDKILDILNYIDRQSVYLKHSQKLNHQRWPTIGSETYPGQVVNDSYESEIQYLKDFLRKRISWMNAEINKF